jgi:glycosyltransferase involved in cell wall biosynthesis
MMTLTEKEPDSHALGKNRPLRIRLVLTQKGWIFEKFAARLAENLPHWNVDVEVAQQACPKADFNHWMVYLDTLEHTDEDLALRSTMFITHVDRPAKLTVLKKRMATTEMGFCMSRMTVDDLVARGLDRTRLCFITAGHDGLIKPRRIKVGITSRLRPDGAKREDILLEAARMTRLDAFQFEIIGAGWEKVIPQLEAAGAAVSYFPGTADSRADYRTNLERVPQFDYYLYMGFDEGSLGLLDALAAGVPTIVTPQGFHLDIAHGITFPIRDAGELREVFRNIQAERQARVNSVARLTWDNYARGHALVWRAILNGRRDEIPQLLESQPEVSAGVGTGSDPAPKTQYPVRWALKKGALYSDFSFLLRHYLGFKRYWRMINLGRIMTGRKPRS